MAGKKPLKPKRLPRVPEQTGRDVVETMARAGMAAAVTSVVPEIAVPLVAAIAACVGSVAPSALAQRLERWAGHAREITNQLRARGVDVEALREDEGFADLVIQSTRAAMQTRSNEKLERLRNVVTNGMLAGDVERATMFLRLVDEFDDLTALVLAFVADPVAECQRAGRPLEQHHAMGRVLYDSWGGATRRRFAGFDSELVGLAIDQLKQRNLATWNPDVEVFAGHGSLTNLGKSFLAYISPPPPVS